MAWLGLKVTTGAQFFDYYVVDPVVVLAEEVSEFVESLVFMPHSEQVLGHRDLIGTVARLPESHRRKHGLGPPGRVLFCNMGRIAKIDPQTFDAWARIIQAVNNSALVITAMSENAIGNLTREARIRGLRVDPDLGSSQLIFMPRSDVFNHVHTKTLCDVYLDTHYMNGHSSTGDMLYAGLPSVTLRGKLMSSRIAASLLTTMGLSDMIADSIDKYISMAIYFGLDATVREVARGRVERARETSPLFDVKRTMTNFQEMWPIMWNKLAKGQLPSTIHLTDMNSSSRWPPDGVDNYG
jgi:predicted O-linked N-acetylglucosamine transferase (SPINDLY family)